MCQVLKIKSIVNFQMFNETIILYVTIQLLNLSKRSIELIHVQVDGASRGNPGLSGVGIVIKHNGIIDEYSIPLGIYSNHEAEFLAIIHALDICIVSYPNNMLAFQTD